jgi:hypothetical protein
VGRKIALGVSVGAAVGALAHPPVAPAASCLLSIHYRDASYAGVDPRYELPPRVGRSGRAFLPPCPAPGQPIPPPTPRDVYRLRGVHPAVAVTDTSGYAYLAEGFFPQLPSHPLHRALFGRAPAPDETARRGCFPARTVSGRVEAASAWGASLKLRVTRAPAGFDPDGDGAVGFVTDGRTRVEGLRRLGLPFVGRGRHVTVSAVRCPSTSGPHLVARRIRASRP